MKSRRTNPSLAALLWLLCCLILLGSGIGSALEMGEDHTSEYKHEDKMTEDPRVTDSEGQPQSTHDSLLPSKTKPTQAGGDEPGLPTTRLMSDAYNTSATTTSGAPATTMGEAATVSQPHTSQAVVTPAVTDGSGTTKRSTTPTEAVVTPAVTDGSGTTKRSTTPTEPGGIAPSPSTLVTTKQAPLMTTVPVPSQGVTTVTVTTPTPQSVTTRTQRTTAPVQPATSTTLGSTLRSTSAGLPQTTPNVPPHTGGPWPSNQPPTQRPTGGPPRTEAPPVNTNKPPPTKPHKPTWPRHTTRPQPPTRRPTNPPTKAPPTRPAVTVPTTTTKTATTTTVAMTRAPTPVIYPDVTIQLFLQTSWLDLCPGLGDFVSSIGRYSKTALSLYYYPDVRLLNDTSSCRPKLASERDASFYKKQIRVDICMLTQGLCDATLTERVGVQMQEDMQELQDFLKPLVLSVQVHRSNEGTRNPHASTKSPTGVAVGVSFTLLLAISAVTIIAYKMYRMHLAKRRALQNRYYFDGKQLHDSFSEAVQLSPVQHRTFTLPVTVHQLVPAINEGFVVDEEEEDFAARKYPSHVLSMHALGQFHCYLEAIVEEFEMLPDFQGSGHWAHSPPKAAAASPGLFHPPPKTRVPLEKCGPDNQHGFLNASYVRGYGKSKHSYIATPAPWGNSVTDFWQMVWEQQSRTVVCLCSPEEMGVVCPWYWPRDEGIQAAQLYGDILVMRQGCVLTENYTVSTLLIKNIQTSLCRPVTHFWFTQWPAAANHVPSSATVLLSFLLQVRQTVQETYGPMVVHCSDGCGRTGTLLAVDSGMHSMEDLCTVNIPSIVCRIRHDRGSAVSQRNQYAFIYKVLYEYSVMLTQGLADRPRTDEDCKEGDTSTC